ncbi:MAG: glucose 1-dehydrogenase [Alphaproteobacteria bacterium]|nr:glucose 1-dehydrogenase [Alphaproteobacteria bacterium]
MIDAGRLFRLDGEVAFITGAGAGLGRMAAEVLASAGALVIASDRDAAAAERVAKTVQAAGGKAETVQLEVTDEAAVMRVVGDAARRRGRIDILINNAGTSVRAPALDMKLADFNRIMAINVTGVFLCAQACGQVMARRRKGAIVNLASIYGLSGSDLFHNLAYTTSKGAVVNMTRGLACEWGPLGIRVNAIAPTFTETDLTRPLIFDNKELVAKLTERTPLRRLGQPQDMAGAILYLASPAASLVTGVTLPVDGGWLAY